MNVKVFVVCADSNGVPAVFETDVTNALNEGDAYDIAIDRAKDKDYNGPFIPMNGKEAENVAKDLLTGPQEKRFLLVIEGDVEARLDGPYESDELRDAAARKHRESDGDLHDGLHRLNVTTVDPNMTVEVSDFAGFEFE